jgi:hypothetical protein
MKYRIVVVRRKNGSMNVWAERKRWFFGFWKNIHNSAYPESFNNVEAAKNEICQDKELTKLLKEQKEGLKVNSKDIIKVK